MDQISNKSFCTGSDAVAGHIVESLGFDKVYVNSMDIHIEASKLVTLQVKFYPSIEAMERLVAVIKTYHLTIHEIEQPSTQKGE